MVTSERSAVDMSLARGLDAVLGKEPAVDSGVNTPDEQLWNDLTSGGWLDFLRAGLSDDDAVSPEAAIAAAERLGAHVVPVGALVACGFLVPLLGGLEDRWPLARDLRSRLDGGGRVGVPVPRVAAEPPGYSFGERMTCCRENDSYRLSGRTSDYLDLDRTTTVLVPVQLPAGGTGLAAVDLGEARVTVALQDTVLPGVCVGVLELDGLRVQEARVFASDVDDLVRRAGAQWSLTLDAHAVGIAAAVLERTVGFAKDREQFGQAIGGFQVVQHAIADMLVALETSRSLLSKVAREYQGSSELTPAGIADVLASRLHSAEMAKAVCESAIQTHGGAGFTWELGLHHWYRAAMFARLFLTDRHGARSALGLVLRDKARRRGVGDADPRSEGTP